MSLPIRLTGLLLLAGAAAAAAEPPRCGCTPITVPATITRPGNYCLKRSFRTNITGESSAAIWINANDVVLDLEGHTIDNRPAGTGTLAGGVLAVDRQNITVRNGTLRGFLVAVGLGCSAPPIFSCDASTVSQGHVVEGIRAQDSRFAGIGAWGLGTIIRDNQVIGTGGNTVPGVTGAQGIRMNGSGSRVLNNDIATVSARGPGRAYGIVFFDSTDVLIVGNRITNSDIGIELASGIVGPTTGKYRDNLTSGVTTPYLGGTDAGNNH